MEEFTTLASLKETEYHSAATLDISCQGTLSGPVNPVDGGLTLYQHALVRMEWLAFS